MDRVTIPKITLCSAALCMASLVSIGTAQTVTVTPPRPQEQPHLLLESGAALLLENGGKILTE